MPIAADRSRPLSIGDHVVDPPVILAPMAGVTNAAFRRLCREFGGGLYVSQMVTAGALLQRTPESMRLIHFDADESPRSLQLYGVDPATMGAAAAMVAKDALADHIDLNFGCPVAKVTRKGGGAALPWKLPLFRSIIRATVEAASQARIPVTVKMRIGIDDDHQTFLDAGKIAEEEGVAAVALHARTASQAYSGRAEWDAITQLKGAVTSIPVLGNGDIWTAEDAVSMIASTGCDGVVVGRGCLGRPWLFADLDAVFQGDPQRVQPSLGQVRDTMARHAQLLVLHFGNEAAGCRDFRKHVAWYLKGYTVGKDLRKALVQAASLAELNELLAGLDGEQVYPGEAAETERGRAGNAKRVALPADWLVDRNVSARMQSAMADAEEHFSGG